MNTRYAKSFWSFIANCNIIEWKMSTHLHINRSKPLYVFMREKIIFLYTYFYFITIWSIQIQNF